MCAWSLSHVRLFVTPWIVARQALLSMGFSRQEYWSGLPFPPPEDLPNPGTEPASPALAGGFFTTEPPGLPYITSNKYLKNKLHNSIIIPRNTYKELCEINLHRKYRIFYKILLREISALCTCACVKMNMLILIFL